MILVGAAALVVVVGMGVVVAAGLGLRRDPAARPDGTGLGPGLAVPAIVVGALALLALVGVLGLGGLRRSSSEGAERPVQPAGAAELRRDDRESEPPSGRPATFDAVVEVRLLRSEVGGGEGAGSLRPAPVADRREAGDVVEVRGQGFDGGAAGVIGQCASTTARRCRNLAPVIADEAGRVRAAYRLEGPASGALLVVAIGDQRGTASLVFGAPAPPPPIVRLRSEILTIADGIPGALVSVARCATDARALDEGCEERHAVRLDGSGRAILRVEPGADHLLLVVADAASGTIIADPVFLPGAARSEVRLDPGRTLTGIAIALLLLGVAVFLIRTTDWRPPSEAATPFLDAATSDA